MNKAQIFFVIALQAEANPIIQYYKLKLYLEKPFRIYRNDNILLIVSGMGSIDSAGATAFLYALSGHMENQLWMNIGIAGHAHFELGKGYLIHKIQDATLKKVYYPSFIVKTSIETAEITTVSLPEMSYPTNSLYDMEVAAFYKMASKFSTSEFIHAFKIISDNLHSDIYNITKEKINLWIEKQIPTIASFICSLENVVNAMNQVHSMPREYEIFISTWHFTHAGKNILKNSLQKWQTIFPKKDIWNDSLKEEYPQTKQILAFVQQKIQDASLI